MNDATVSLHPVQSTKRDAPGRRTPRSTARTAASSLGVAAATLLCTAPLAAQAYRGEGPGHMAPPHTNSRLGATALGVSQVGQLLLTPIAGSRHYLTASVWRVGGVSADLLSGEFDEATQVFTPNGDVTHFNTPGDEWALSVSRDLLTATFDSPNGVMWARRSTPTQPFGQPAPVLNVPAGYIDPTLCTVNGNLHLMYVWGIDLWIGRFADGVLYDTWLLAAKPPTSDFAHSPSPMTTADGETEALVFAAYTSGMGSQPYFQSDLDATRGTPAHQLLNRPSNWLANPDANGGRVRYAEAIAGYGDPVELELVAVASTEASTDGGAGALELVVFAPTRSGAQSTMLGTVALGVLGAGPLPLPFLGGSALSLDPSSLVTLPPALLDRNSGTLRYRLDLPPTPELTLHAVPLVFDGQRGFLGNAGVVTLKAKESKCAEPEVMMPAANGSCQPGYRLMNLIRISGGSVRSTTGCYKCTGGCANGTCQPVIVTLVGIPGSQADVVRCYCR